MLLRRRWLRRGAVFGNSCVRSVALMGTVVTIGVVARATDPESARNREEAVERAFDWFERVEECCSRFDEQSELMKLAAQPGVAVPASTMLYEAVQFALAMAEQSGGALDPTVGYAMENRGFNEEYRSGRTVRTELKECGPVSYRDVRLDPERRTITLLRPLILDLGAVAKGMAIDLAVRELRPLENFVVDAGGDLYACGLNSIGEPWSIGIKHPRRPNELIESLRVSNRAVCTSGDYERPSPIEGGAHHILDPRTGVSPRQVASVTVVADTATLADAAATAVFVLGPSEGIEWCERLGVEGLIYSDSPGTASLERYATREMGVAHAS